MTSPLPPDPIDGIGVAGFARDVRAGKTNFAAATDAYLARIERLNGTIKAFVHVDAEGARRMARGLDAMLAAGQDLGPLMGVPVAIKDLLTVTGMPVTAGSRVNISDLVQPEGSFVAKLRHAGCVILGKTRTTEFASGGYNFTHPTPLNPWSSPDDPLMTGGSSNGSAAALAAGLTAFSIGSDTGGSVRIPAAYCGLVGFKTSVGRWPTDGVFPLSPTLDTLGFFAHDMGDAATILSALDGVPIPPRSARGLRLARPTSFYFDDATPEALAAFDRALAALTKAGATIAPVEIPEAAEITNSAGLLVPVELLATLGRARVTVNAAAFDPPVIRRLMSVWNVTADTYARLHWRRHELVAIARAKMDGFDAWVSLSAPAPPPPISSIRTFDDYADWNMRSSRCTRPGNLFDQCGISIPLVNGPLDKDRGGPLGLQLCAALGRDEELIGIAAAVESVIGVGKRPSLSGLL